MLVCPNQLKHPRLGLAIAARIVPTAVGRNRIKRLIRESFRAHQAELPAADIVLNARAGARLASNVHIVNRLEEYWRIAVRLCERS
jgi:ribonuclease P protein component